MCQCYMCDWMDEQTNKQTNKQTHTHTRTHTLFPENMKFWQLVCAAGTYSVYYCDTMHNWNCFRCVVAIYSEVN